MKTTMKWTLLGAALLLLIPAIATAVVEKKTGTEYPDEIEIGDETGSMKLVATGVGLREKTFLKVDVYTIVSYVPAGSELGEDAALGVVMLDEPKRLQLDLRRGFSREKLINAFIEGIHANYDDTSAFEADMEAFQGYFTRDAEENDRIIFHYCPERGLTTELNGEKVGTIANKEFAQALWTVWFGKKPANKDLRKALLAEVGS